MTPETPASAKKYYPLKNNPPLVEICKVRRANGMSFEYFKDVHARGACAQLTEEDIKLLEEQTRPAT